MAIDTTEVNGPFFMRITAILMAGDATSALRIRLSFRLLQLPRDSINFPRDLARVAQVPARPRLYTDHDCAQKRQHGQDISAPTCLFDKSEKHGGTPFTREAREKVEQ